MTMKDFNKWIRVALLVEITMFRKESAGWHYFYGLKTSHDIGVADHNELARHA